MQWLRSGLDTRGRGGCLFVHGAPGMGKTRAVGESVIYLSKERRCDVTVLNAMLMTSGNLIACALYKAILKKNREPNGALDFLSRFFGSKDRTACVTEELRTHKGGDGSSVEDPD